MTALSIAGGADIVRVHDVRGNVRAARMADAIVRGRLERSGAERRVVAVGRGCGAGSGDDYLSA